MFSLDGASPVTWRACHPSCALADAGAGTSLRFTGTDDPPQSPLAFLDGASVVDLRRQRFAATETEDPRSRIVTFQSGPLGEGVTLEKRFEVSKTGYEVVMAARLLGPNAAAFATGRRLELDLEAGRGLVPAPAAGFTAKLDRVERVILGAGGVRVPGDAGNLSTPLGSGDWVGFRSRFWTVAARPDRASVLMSRPEGGLALVAAAGPDMVSWRYVFYSGPVEFEALTRADPDLGRLLFAGLWFWLRALSLALLHLLHWLITLTGNAGVAIVALAVSVKIALMPLAAVAHRLQEQVNATQARLQPGIEAINAAYRGEERTRRTLALYREQGVHPMYTVRSLVGFLIQFPVFIAVFDMLAEDFDLYRVPFLWIRDLSRPVLRLPPEPAAVSDERDFCCGSLALSLCRPHAVAPPQAAEKPARHDPALLRPLLHVPRRHGAVLDVDERRPARQPGARAVMAVPAPVGRLSIGYCRWWHRCRATAASSSSAPAEEWRTRRCGRSCGRR